MTTPSVVLVSPWPLPLAGANGERAPVPWISAIGMTVAGGFTVNVKVTSSVTGVGDLASVTVTVTAQVHVAVGVPET